MEANKSECETCIRIAQRAIAAEEYEKANKFLLKAQKLYPSELVNSKTNNKINKRIGFYLYVNLFLLKRYA
jgi:hypothetical protein